MAHTAPELHYRIEQRDWTECGIGIIGLGWVVQNYHLRAYRRGGFRVVAVADLKEAVVERTKEQWGVPIGHTDYRALLDNTEVRIVDVSTRTFGRKQIVLDCIRANKHVLCQKPFARDYREAVEMVEAAESQGVRLAVNSHYRWLCHFRAARELLGAGCIGEPYYITVDMLGSMDRLYWDELPERRWNADLDDFIQVEWGAHLFDFLRFWTGREPDRIYATGTRRPAQHFKGEMAYTIVVEFEGLLRAAFTLNQTSVADRGWLKYRIDGTEGLIECTDFSRVECFSSSWAGWHAWELEKSFEDLVDWSYIGVMGDLVNAVAEGREHASSGRDNLGTIRCCLAAQRSEQLGRPVRPAEIPGPAAP
jgi:predicted dehydrogenase